MTTETKKKINLLEDVVILDAIIQGIGSSNYGMNKIKIDETVFYGLCNQWKRLKRLLTLDSQSQKSA